MPRSVSGSMSPLPSTSRPICASGASTRPIGRRESEASPVIVTVMSCPAITPIMSRVPVPELPKSIGAAGLGQSARAAPQHLPDIADLRRGRAERGDGLRRIDDVLGLEQPADARPPGGERPEHQRPVRDRLVAGNADAAP